LPWKSLFQNNARINASKCEKCDCNAHDVALMMNQPNKVKVFAVCGLINEKVQEEVFV